MQSAPFEIIYRICSFLIPSTWTSTWTSTGKSAGIQDLISFSGTCHSFLLFIRNQPWPFDLDDRKLSSETICHVFSTYQFRSIRFFLWENLDQISEDILRAPETLILGYSDTSGNFLAHFMNPSNLQVLNASNCHELEDRGIMTLCNSRSRSFQEIQLTKSKLTSVAYQALAQIGSQKLYLNGRFTDTDLQTLFSSGKYEELNLSFCHLITDAAFAQSRFRSVKINTCQLISTLEHFRDCQIVQYRGFYAKLSNLRNCQELSLTFLSGAKVPFLKQELLALSQYRKLRKLSLYPNRINEVGYLWLEETFPGVEIISM